MAPADIYDSRYQPISPSPAAFVPPVLRRLRGIRANGSRLRNADGAEEESIMAPAAAPASASSSTARRSRRQGADFACDPIMIAVIASSTAPRLPASLQDLGSSPKEAKKQAGPPLYHKRIEQEKSKCLLELTLW